MRLFLKILAGLVALVILALVTVFTVSTVKLGKRVTITDPAPVIPTDSASIARGRYFTTAIAKCVGCHRGDLGGEQMIPGGPFARIASANLTSGRGGVTPARSDAQLVNAIRHGVSGHGRPLYIMPSEFYNRLSDEDVAAIVAYVRSVPPVDRELPPSTLGPLGRALLVAGQLKGFISAFDIDHNAAREATPPAGPTAEYGAYLTTVGACKACHGQTLSGGAAPGGPPGSKPPSNITPEGLKAYDEAAFFRALREGRRPDGTAIDTTQMPIPMTKLMTDDDIRGVWLYLQSVPPKPFGGR